MRPWILRLALASAVASAVLFAQTPGRQKRTLSDAEVAHGNSLLIDTHNGVTRAWPRGGGRGAGGGGGGAANYVQSAQGAYQAFFDSNIQAAASSRCRHCRLEAARFLTRCGATSAQEKS